MSKQEVNPAHLVQEVRTQIESWSNLGLSSVSNPPAAAQSSEMESLKSEALSCTKCPHLVQNRTKVVFGVGDVNADLVFVGEAPGFDEDKQGEPFVGKAGQLLTKMIQAMGLRRDQVYICNVLKCRPPENRNPMPDEVDNCEPFLKSQLNFLSPKIIVVLGKFAAQTLLKTTTPISRLRGRFQEYESIPVMPTFHPAYLLRNASEKKAVWEDLKQVMVKLGLKLPR